MEHLAVNMFSEYSMQHVIFLVSCGIILLLAALCIVLFVCDWKNDKSEESIENTEERLTDEGYIKAKN